MNKTLMMQVHNYAKLWGVVVKVQGSVAYTNGKDITIPRFDIQNEHSCRLACAYLAHESGHIAYSDFSLLSKVVSSDKKLLYTLLNIVEDSRIERLMSSKWIGVYENLLMLNKELSKLAIKSLGDLKRSTVNLIPRMLQITSWLCQKYMQQYDTANYILDTLKAYPKLKDFTYKLAELLMNTPICNDTKEAYELAKKINKLFTTEYDYIKSKSKSKSKQSTDGGADNTDSTDNTDGTTAKDKSLFSKSSDDLAQGAETFGTWSINTVMESSVVSTSSNSSTREDLGIVSECPRMQAGSANWLQSLGLVVQTNSVTLALHNYIKAKTLALSEQTDMGNRINVKRALRIPLGEDRIWDKKTYDLDHNTSIHILVDISSSMLACASEGNFNNYKYSRCDHAKVCAYCIAKALEGIPNTESQVSFFPGCDEDGRNYEVGMCKQANESVQRTFKYFDQHPMGSTPLAQAMAYALSKFNYSDKDRNIILIITDGMPDSVSNVQQQIKQCENLAVEIRVLSINCEVALKLFSNCVVTNAENLLDNANKVIKQLFS